MLVHLYLLEHRSSKLMLGFNRILKKIVDSLKVAYHDGRLTLADNFHRQQYSDVLIGLQNCLPGFEFIVMSKTQQQNSQICSWVGLIVTATRCLNSA